MFPRWVTNSYSPPDDVMSSNCNNVASGFGAKRKKRENETTEEDILKFYCIFFFLFVKANSQKIPGTNMHIIPASD